MPDGDMSNVIEQKNYEIEKLENSKSKLENKL